MNEWGEDAEFNLLRWTPCPMAIVAVPMSHFGHCNLYGLLEELIILGFGGCRRAVFVRVTSEVIIWEIPQ